MTKRIFLKVFTLFISFIKNNTKQKPQQQQQKSSKPVTFNPNLFLLFKWHYF